MKLTVDTYKAVKEAYGDRCICEAIVAWEQPYGYGMTGNDGRGVTFDDVLEFCKAIDPYVDLIQVREHDGCRSHPHGYNFTPGDHPAVEACGRMKQALSLIHICTDQFGGSVENQARFAILVLQRIRDAVGDDFIVEMRFSVEEGIEPITAKPYICLLYTSQSPLLHRKCSSAEQGFLNRPSVMKSKRRTSHPREVPHW